MCAFAELNWQVGSDLGVSAWKRVRQNRIDQFALATDDLQFVHVDPERAARETPFGGTIAHGFLTLSLISAFATEALPACDDVRAAVVVAIDRIKFQAPVKVDARIRGVFRLQRMNWLGPTQCLIKVDVRIEIDGERKPALTGEVSWILHIASSVGQPGNAQADDAQLVA
jgi:acyl dehydratase